MAKPKKKAVKVASKTTSLSKVLKKELKSPKFKKAFNAEIKKKSANKVVAKKVVARAPKKVVIAGAYRLTLSLNSQDFVGVGLTALDAFNNVVVPPQMVKTKVTLKLEHEGKSMQMNLFGTQYRRILGSRVAKEIWAKRIVGNLK